MNDIKWIEHHSAEAKARLKKRGDVPQIDELLQCFKERRELIMLAEALKHQRNEINEALKSASKSEIEAKREEMRAMSMSIKAADSKLLEIEQICAGLSSSIPNIPHEAVPEGTTAEDNLVVREVLAKPQFAFVPRDHVEIGRLTDTIDFARAVKISGSRFAFLKGPVAMLNRALMQFFCNYHIERGDLELCPPFMVHAASMFGVGQFPKFIDGVFKIDRKEAEPLYLIPTAEAPVTNFLADEIIDEADLPLRFCAYSPCFRSEAGAAGQDTRGLIRMHQFEKVEMVRFAHPEQSAHELELMVERASNLLSLLELPHRIVELCGGDLGFHSERTFDLEVWLPAQNTFREISSCSSFGSFQARRAKIRMRTAHNKIEPLVTLNGSGLPLGRTIVAILENHQQADGSVRIPEILRSYMNGLALIKNVDLK